MRKTILTIALMSAMSAMAQEHAEVDVHARYTKAVSYTHLTLPTICSV